MGAMSPAQLADVTPAQLAALGSEDVADLSYAVVDSLTAKGWEVDDCDLNAEGFNPVMSADERRGYAEDVPLPVARLAPERTVYVGGLSKSVATGLRVGELVSLPASDQYRVSLVCRLRVSCSRLP